MYAAGVVLYELLTGRKPHEGDSPIQVAYKHVHEDVPPPSALVPGLPAYVDALVARATARDRSHRPADARVLLHQVHRVSQALDAGVPEDPELVADLAPPLAVVVLEPELDDHDTDRADEQALADADAPYDSTGDVGDRRHTDPLDGTPLPRHDHASTGAEPAGARAADHAPAAGRRRPVAARRSRPRRSSRGPMMLLVALLLAAGGGAGAWYFGWARYTCTPGVIGLTEAAGRGPDGQGRARLPRSATRRTPRPSPPGA